MSTQLFFRSTTPDWSRGQGDVDLRGNFQNWTQRSLGTTRGAAATTLTATSIVGPTPGIVAGTSIEFISDPIDRDITIAGAITVNLWGTESSMNANASICVFLERLDKTGAVASVLVQQSAGTELNTVSGVISTTPTPSSTNMLKGDRFRCRVFFDDATAVTMASGFPLTFTYDGPTSGADGDSFITFTENFRFLTTNSVAPLHTAGSASVNVGTTAEERWAQSFYMPADGSITSVDVKVFKTGAPTDNLIAAIQADSAGAPSGTDLASATVAGTSLTTTATVTNFNVADTALSGGQPYWLVLRRSGALSGTNNYNVSTDSTVVETFGWSARYASSAWTNFSLGVLVFQTYMTFSNSTLYLTDTVSTIDPNGATFDTKEAWTSRGGSTVFTSTNTAAGPTSPLQRRVNAGTTNFLEWFSKPLQAFTLSGLAFCNIRCGTSGAGAANASAAVEIAVCASDGTSPTVWGYAVDGTETLTTATYSFYVAGDDVAITNGQRLRIRLFIDDAPGVAMAAGQSSGLSHNGPTAGIDGDTYIVVPQTVTAFSPSPVTVSNSAEGGTNGTTITPANSGGASGDAFDSVGGGSGLAKFSNAHPVNTGSMGIDLYNALGQTNAVAWSRTFGDTVYGRAYIYLDARATSQFNKIEFVDLAFANVLGAVQVRGSDGKLTLLDDTQTVVGVSTMNLSLNTMYRIEWKFVSHISAGTIEARIYAGHSATPLETVSLTGQNTNGGLVWNVRFLSVADASTVAHCWLDDLNANNTAFPGPSGSDTTPVAVSDSATVSDTVATRVTDVADSGVGSDVGDLARPVSDTATAADTAIVTVPISVADSAVGTETSDKGMTVTEVGSVADTAPTLAKTVSDAAVGTDTSDKGMTAVDSASGLDTSAVTVPIAVTDTAVGADSIAAAARDVTDQGAAADTSVLVAVYATSETAAGADTSILTAAYVLSDTAASADSSSLTVGAQDVVASDSAVGTDTSAIDKLVSDAATGVDASSLTAAVSVTDAGAAVDSSGVTAPVTATDAGVGVEASLLAAVLTASDAATGADTSTLTAVPTVSDSAAGADISSLTTGNVVDVVDSGAASDVSVLTVAIPVTDVATGSDVSSLATALPVSDTAVGVDVSAINKLVSDSAVGSDVSDLARPVSDSAVAVDTATINKLVADTAIGTDVVGAIPATVSVNDAAVGSDTSALSTANQKSVNEVGVAVDTSALTATNSVADSGSSVDLVAETVLWDRTDAAVGTDASVLTAALTVTDAVVGADASALTSPVAVTDSGTAADTSAINKAVSDAGTGTDAITTVARAVTDAGTAADVSSLITGTAVNVVDSATGTETAAITAVLTAQDTAAGLDTAALLVLWSRSDAAVGVDTSQVVIAIPVQDQATGIDTSQIKAALTVLDQGLGVDQAALAAQLFKTVSDSAHGVDIATVRAGLPEAIELLARFSPILVTRARFDPKLDLAGRLGLNLVQRGRYDPVMARDARLDSDASMAGSRA